MVRNKNQGNENLNDNRRNNHGDRKNVQNREPSEARENSRKPGKGAHSRNGNNQKSGH